MVVLLCSNPPSFLRSFLSICLSTLLVIILCINMGDHTLMHFSFWYLPLRCYYLYMYCFLLWLITYLFTAAAAAAATATTIHTAVIPQSILKKTI